jgi:hypothetical protein
MNTGKSDDAYHEGKIINGNIVVEGESFSEGAVVTVLVSDEQTFTLSDAEEATLGLLPRQTEEGTFAAETY